MNSDPTTVFFTPMDHPGLICLFQEENFAYLTPTSKCIADFKDLKTVSDLEGKEYKLEESKYDKKSYCINSPSVGIGDVFTPTTPLIETKYGFSGRFCGELACIAILMKLTEALSDKNFAVCFTAGFYSKGKAECNVMNRIKAKEAILLGVANDPEDNVILAVKDGKHFASKSLSDKITEKLQNSQISLKYAVYDQASTAAESLHSVFAEEVVSLILPCKEKYSAEESVSSKAIQDMSSVFQMILDSRS